MWAFELFQEEDFIRELGLSKNTVVNWRNFHREICSQHFDYNPIQIGGIGHIVEIDETALVREKYKRGRPVKSTWIFGRINRETKEAFFVILSVVLRQC